VAIWLALSALLRLVLFVVFHAGSLQLGSLLSCLAVGSLLDALTAGALCLPLSAPLVLAPASWLGRRWVRAPFVALALAGAVFLAFVEYFFFEEFLSRFNHVALDYLIYPTEVFTNLSASYDVSTYLAVALVAGAGATALLERRMAPACFPRLSRRARLSALGAASLTSCAALGALWLLPWKLRAERLEDEVAHNGLLGLVHALATGELDFPTFYLSLPKEEAARRAVAVLGPPRARLESGLQRTFVPHPSSAPPPHQVIVILEESLGSEFVGALGHADKELTPHFDRWSQEGLLLTQLVPTGNRTVRGMEGVLASFVPLPGDALLRRDKSEDIATLAGVYREHGFRTAFLYGGRMSFDSMGPFLAHNGWEELLERSDYPADAFQTAWGAADEFVFDALLERQQAARARGEKLFATLLSVSNHKPYDVPLDDAHVQSVRAGRWRAVAYADSCIGRYLDRARAQGLLDDALVLIVGDHGARVYGSADIPAASYRIPALFLGNDPDWRGRRIERLCSQIDLAPTLLSLSGLTAVAPFFGQDLLDLPAQGGRAFLQHNRDVGMLTDTELVVLGLHKSVTFYERSGKESDEFRALASDQVTPSQHELALDAAAVFQTAHELYEARQYHLPHARVVAPTGEWAQAGRRTASAQ
jgi:phosphoglycerol transferase MdoB-like AlkP superfamily enzyme